MNVRVARAGEEDMIASIQARSYRARGEMSEAFLQRLEGSDQAARWTRLLADILVVEGAGFAWSGPAGEDRSVGEVYLLAVDPDHWRTGVATALLDAAVDRLRALGFASAILWTGESNTPARRTYERHGWSIDGGTKCESYAGTPYPEVRYRREL